MSIPSNSNWNMPIDYVSVLTCWWYCVIPHQPFPVLSAGLNTKCIRDCFSQYFHSSRSWLLYFLISQQMCRNRSIYDTSIHRHIKICQNNLENFYNRKKQLKKELSNRKASMLIVTDQTNVPETDVASSYWAHWFDREMFPASKQLSPLGWSGLVFRVWICHPPLSAWWTLEVGKSFGDNRRWEAERGKKRIVVTDVATGNLIKFHGGSFNGYSCVLLHPPSTFLI